MLIGITGRAGSGKDTLADQLVRQHGAVKYSFALPIKQALNAAIGWDLSQWEDRLWKEAVQEWLGKSPRELAQTLGTEWGREYVHPQLWVLLASRRYRLHLANAYAEHGATAAAAPFVIPDVRFDNESHWINEAGGVLIEVRRPQAAAIAAHKSEIGLDPSIARVVVENDADIVTFLQRCETALGLSHGTC